MLKKLSIGFLVVFLALQFVRPEKNRTDTAAAGDLLAVHRAPAEVQQWLRKACYDCHSNHTRYPWYAEIQPVSAWLASHVADGKSELNFSEFTGYSPKRAVRKLEDSIEQIEMGHMPLTSYTLLHPEARLSDAQKQQLIAWLEATVETLQTH